MKKMVLCLLALCLFCGGPAFSGESIRVLLPRDSWVDALERHLIPEFEKETGIKVRMESFHEDQLSQKLGVEFTAGTDLDVFVTRPLNEGRMFERNGWYADLTPYFKDDAEYDFYNDFAPAAQELTRINGIQTCIPVSNECHVLYYRTDIFEKHGLRPPKTFAELEETAKLLTDRGNDFYGVLLRGQRSPLVTQFSSFLYGFGGDWFDAETGKATFDTPEALNAIDFYGRLLREYGPPGAANMSWPQMMAVYQQGKGAMYLDATGHFFMLLDPAKSDLASKTAVAVFPAGPVANHPWMIPGTGLAIYSGSKNKDTAWKFIRFITDKVRTRYILSEFGYLGARQSSLDNPEELKKFPVDMAETIAIESKYARSYDRPMLTATQEARDVVGKTVVVSIMGGDYKAAAKKANEGLQALLDRER